MKEGLLHAPFFDADVHGYKAFNKDWTCLKRQYSCPGEFRSQNIPSLCQTGMHFCITLDNVFKYYGYDLRKIHVAEVKAFGSVAFGADKCSTNGLQIIKELSIKDILSKVGTITAHRISNASCIDLIYNCFGDLVGYKCGSEWWPGTTKIMMLLAPRNAINERMSWK